MTKGKDNENSMLKSANWILSIASWLLCPLTAIVFTFCWGMSAFGSHYLNATVYAFISVPAVISITIKTIKKGHADILNFIFSTMPWLLFPIISICTFVPAGESGQWIALEILTIMAFIIPLMGIYSTNARA